MLGPLAVQDVAGGKWDGAAGGSRRSVAIRSEDRPDLAQTLRESQHARPYHGNGSSAASHSLHFLQGMEARKRQVEQNNVTFVRIDVNPSLEVWVFVDLVVSSRFHFAPCKYLIPSRPAPASAKLRGVHSIRRVWFALCVRTVHGLAREAFEGDVSS